LSHQFLIKKYNKPDYYFSIMDPMPELQHHKILNIDDDKNYVLDALLDFYYTQDDPDYDNITQLQSYFINLYERDYFKKHIGQLSEIIINPQLDKAFFSIYVECYTGYYPTFMIKENEEWRIVDIREYLK